MDGLKMDGQMEGPTDVWLDGWMVGNELNVRNWRLLYRGVAPAKM